MLYLKNKLSQKMSKNAKDSDLMFSVSKIGLEILKKFLRCNSYGLVMFVFEHTFSLINKNILSKVSQFFYLPFLFSR